MNHGTWGGCEATVEFDDSVVDIILHDRANLTFTSIKETFGGILRNRQYLLDKEICAKKVDGVIQVANCDC